MRNLKLFMSLMLGLWVITSSMYADNPRQTVTKELLSKTMSGGITTLDWVVRYESNSSTPLNDVVITDDFSSAQTYVPSTEAHPNGWSVTQTPNRFVWESGDGSGYSNSFPFNNGAISVPGTGDGYAPIHYTSITGEKRIYFLNHHQSTTANSTLFNCVGECTTSGVWPRVLPDGDIGTNNINTGTNNAPETVIIGKYMFYSVTRVSDSGLGCYNLEDDVECGYLQLSTLGDTSNRKMEGPFKVGSDVILIDASMKTYKVNIVANTMTLNATFDMSTSGLSTQNYIDIGAEVVGGKVYFIVGQLINKFACLDTSASMSSCASWGSSKSIALGATSYGPSSYLYYDSAMVATDICSKRSGLQSCVSLLNGSDTSSKPEPFASANEIGGEFLFGNKTYAVETWTSNVHCYDWVSASVCTPAVITEGQFTSGYATEVDSDGCAWVYGDASILWNFDAQTGVSPCGGETLVIEDSYDASKNWCASDDVEWKYTQFKISGLSPNMFTDLNVTFYDASGNVIKVANLPSNAVSFSQGLFTAPFIAGQPIHYKITGTRNPNANPNSTPPTITIGVEGPPREFCFQTTVPCPVTGDITNHVEVQLKGEHSVDSSADVVEDAGALCEEVLPDPPKQCLNAEPTLTCTKTGWTIDLDTFSPASFNASNTDMQVLAPSGATVTKWGNTWHVNGVSGGDTLSLSMQGVLQGAGKLEGGDLCCDGETNITISASQQCPVQMPEINVMKTYEDGVFKLHAGVLGEIHAPQLFTIGDTIPDGMTITGVDPRSPDWNCGSSFPVVGPAVLNCVYTGTMPVVTGAYDLYLTSTIDNSKLPIENCMDTGIIQTDGTTVYTDPRMHHCVTVEETEDNCTAPIIKATKIFKGCNEFNTKCTFELTLTNTDTVNPYNGNVFVSEQTTQPNVGVVPIPVTSITPAGLCTVMPTMTPFMCVTPMSFTAGETKTFMIEVNPYGPGGYNVEGGFNAHGTENCFGAFPTSSSIATGNYTEESWKAAAIAAGFGEENPPPCMDNMSGACAGYEENNVTEDNDTVTPDTNETNTSCAENEILIDGVCTQLPENPCPDGSQMVDGHCVEMPEINCQSNIVLVVDKSDSINAAGSGAKSDVRDMMNSFLSRFRGNGSQAAIVYFDTSASIVRPMSTINVGDTAPYYSPTIGGLTNWEDALEKTRSIVSAGDIVFFITDGQPNRYLNAGANIVPTGVPPSANTPALTALENLATLEASVVANQIKAMGVRIVSVGVGSIGSSASAIQHLNDIASTPSDININAFDELSGVADDYGKGACPALLLEKHFLNGTPQHDGCIRIFLGEEIPTNKVELKVQNTTSMPLTAIVVRDVLPTGITNPTALIASNGTFTVSGNTVTWNVGTLAPNASEVLRFDVGIPSVNPGDCTDVVNYAEVINAVGVDITPLLADSQNGPINMNGLDESKSCLRVCRSIPSTPTYGMFVRKIQDGGEGNCIAGGECRYTIYITNNDPITSYTPTLNISDTMTPSSATSPATITAQGTAPDPICSPAPTSIPFPFPCTQITDIPPNTTWKYKVVMSNTPQNATKNTFTVNSSDDSFYFSNNKSMESNDTGCQTDKDCSQKEYCSEEDGLCLPKEHVDEPVVHLPVIDIPIVKPKPRKAHITLRKTAPKECKAGQKCTFKLRITNKGKASYSGPLSITDRSREFVGKLVGTSPRGWKCKTTRKGYVCANPKVSLKAGESTTVKLTIRIPQRAKGYLNNCAKLDFPRGKVKVMAMQSMLLEHGFDPNGIDGGMGKGTKKALKAYMKSKGIKSQKEAIKTLVQMYPHVRSKDSCVKVKIKKSKVKCKKHEKLVRDVCKPRCKKWQNWNGKKCVSCPKGTKWDKRRNECREKTRPNVHINIKPKGKKCPNGYIRFGNSCEKIADKEHDKECGFLTKFNPRTGRCDPIINISIGIGGGGGDKDKPRKEHDRDPAGY